jgi:dUTPase
MVFAKIEQVHFIEVQTINETLRGKGGFGSTGKL